MEFTRNRETAGKILLAIGMVLVIYTCIFSDLGLDTHVLMAVEEGSLPWGHTRTQDPLASDLDYAPQYYDRADVIYGILDSEFKVKLASFASMATLVALCGFLTSKNNEENVSFNFVVAAMISIYPAFIFSSGRGYMEVPIAIIFLLTHLGYCTKRQEEQTSIIRKSIIAGLGISVIASLKGLNPIFGLLWTVYLLAIDAFQNKFENKVDKFFPIFIGLGFSSVVVLLTLDHGNILNSIWFLFAALVDVSLFLIIGLCLTHIIFSEEFSISKFLQSNFQTSVVIFSVIIACSYWIADLWLTETALWSTSSLDIFIIMGNNGRYVTMIAPFILLALNNYGQSDLFDFNDNRKKIFAFNLVLVVLLASFAGIHGQKMWTDDAANSLTKNIQDGDEFVLIHENELAMHWLYTMYSEFEREELDVTGHWRSPDSNFISEIEDNEAFAKRSSLENVSYVVVQPGIEMELPDDWELIESGRPPKIFGDGEWVIYRI